MVAETLFALPEPWIAAFEAGRVVRVGTLLKSVETGRIVAHMQETGALEPLARHLLGGAGQLVSGPLGPVLSTVGIVQNEQIKGMLHVVQTLQIGNLVLTGIGIGVSVAGFAILHRRIARLEDRLDGLSAAVARVEAGVEALHAEALRQDLDRLDAACRALDEGWHLAAPERQWQDCAHSLHEIERRFERRAAAVLGPGGGPADPDLADLLLDAFVLAAATRLTARMACDEEAAALAAARDLADRARALSGHIGADWFLARERAALARPGETATALGALDAALPEARRRAALLREREAAAATKLPLLLDLRDRGLSPRRFLEAARAGAAGIGLLPTA